MKPDAQTFSLPPTDTSRAAPPPASDGLIDSAQLLGARDEVEILHSGETYRLRRTRQGKLILTK